MFLDLPRLAQTNGMNIRGIIHVGAHLGEEAQTYSDMGIKWVTWVEANPQVIPKLIDHVTPYGHRVVLALVLDETKEGVLFNVTNYDGMSSSVYPWGTHTSFSPDTVIDHTIVATSTTLDDICFGGSRRNTAWTSTIPAGEVNMLNIDVEGANLDVLKGAEKLLEGIDYLYLEIQTEPVYKGAPLLPEYDEWLLQRGYRRVALHMVEGQGWGDALWIR